MGPPAGTLHAEARQLAQPSRDRDQSLLPLVSGKTEDPRSGLAPERIAGLESANEPRSSSDRLEVQQEGRPKKVWL